jgi:hypothetical protein
MGLSGFCALLQGSGHQRKNYVMKRLIGLAGLAAVLLGGCAYNGHDRMASGRGDYYDSYYDGSYGTFSDGYWGKDGAFY